MCVLQFKPFELLGQANRPGLLWPGSLCNELGSFDPARILELINEPK